MTYRCVAKGGKSFRNTEFFRFEGDKIRRIDVYFGATYQDGVFVKQPAILRISGRARRQSGSDLLVPPAITSEIIPPADVGAAKPRSSC